MTERPLSTAVVTGSSTGIGAATSLALARAGLRVVGTVRRAGSAEQLLADAAAEGLDVSVVELDVDDDGSVAQGMAAAREVLGEIDVLVNNAGFGHSRVVEDASIDDFRAHMETNFFGALRCTKEVLPSMRERRRGALVTVSSQAGRWAIPALTPYVASKYALEGMTEALAFQVARFGVRVALIEPGAIITATLTKSSPWPDDTAYGHVYDAFTSLVIDDFAEGSPASLVADCIVCAVTTDEPRLRWEVGSGAARNIAGRAALSDEEWVAIAASPDDDQVVAGFRRALGR